VGLVFFFFFGGGGGGGGEGSTFKFKHSKVNKIRRFFARYLCS